LTIGNVIPDKFVFEFVASEKTPDDGPLNLHFPGEVDFVSKSILSEQMYLSLPTSQGETICEIRKLEKSN